MHLPTSQEGRYSQSLERGLAILRAFTPERPWMGIAEIAERLEMSRPTTHRYASTLVALNYLEQGRGRKYRLGLRAGDPGRAAVASTVLRALPEGLLSSLRDRSHCSAGLAVLDGADVVYVDRARSSRQGRSEISARLGRGSRLPAADTAMGRVLLTELTPEDLLARLGGSTKARPAQRTKLAGELERIRRDGFAIAEQPRVDGQRSIAAPIQGRSGAAIAAVEVSCNRSDYTIEQARERLAPLVCETARSISTKLGRRAG